MDASNLPGFTGLCPACLSFIASKLAEVFPNEHERLVGAGIIYYIILMRHRTHNPTPKWVPQEAVMGYHSLQIMQNQYNGVLLCNIYAEDIKLALEKVKEWLANPETAPMSIIKNENGTIVLNRKDIKDPDIVMGITLENPLQKETENVFVPNVPNKNLH